MNEWLAALNNIFKNNIAEKRKELDKSNFAR
jgi:hypothetical protein